jgi:hypothetical protein
MSGEGRNTGGACSAKPATSLTSAIEVAHGIRVRMNSVNERLQNLKDRLQGASPEVASESDLPDNRGGEMGQLEGVLRELGAHADYAGQLLAEIEQEA